MLILRVIAWLNYIRKGWYKETNVRASAQNPQEKGPVKMRCPRCETRLKNIHVPKNEECTTCGTKLLPVVQDILEFKKYGIVEEVRPAQVKMGRDIEQLLTQPKGTLMAEGGTGIGKSYAYLIPALLAAGKRVVVATAMNSLQDQLYEKDLPHLVNKMGISNGSYGIFKGKNHYMCRKRKGMVPPKEKDKLKAFLLERGDKPLDVAYWGDDTPWWWGDISAENCRDRRSCPYSKNCRPDHKKLNFLITNHSILGIDIKQGGTIIGPYDILIVDEAHKVIDNIRSMFASRMTRGQVGKVSNSIQQDDDLLEYIDDSGLVLAKDCKTGVKDVVTAYNILHKKVEQTDPFKGGIRLELIQDEVSEMIKKVKIPKGQLFLISEQLTAKIKRMQGKKEEQEAAKLRQKNKKEEQKRAKKTNNDYNEDFLLEEWEGDAYTQNLLKGDYNFGHLEKYLDTIVRTQKSLNRMLEFLSGLDLQNEDCPEADTEVIYHDHKGIYRKPVQVWPVVKPYLNNISHKIMVSATLAVGTDFSHFCKQLAYDPTKIATRIYKSPFNLDEQVRLFIPPLNMPLPAVRGEEGRNKWIASTARMVQDLVRITDGDALVLCNSEHDLIDITTYMATHGAWEDLNLTPIVQQGKSAPALRKYMATPRSVLFGLDSFWEGIDIPGPKLKMSIITKLPFAHPGDPLYRALCKLEGNQWFKNVAEPAMIFKMRQGAGRVIRKKTDHGIVACTDIRIRSGQSKLIKHQEAIEQIREDPQGKSKGYGKRTIDALGYRKKTDQFTILKEYVKKHFNIR